MGTNIKYDLWSYMTMPLNRHTLNSAGETFYFELDNPAHGFLCKNRNAEELFLGEDGWIWRGLDTSPNQFEAYATWTNSSRQVWGHPWIPRFVTVGQEFTIHNYTLFFMKSSGNAMTPTMLGNPNVDHNGGYSPTYRVKVAEYFPTFVTQGGKHFNNVVQIDTFLSDGRPFETFWFAEGYSMIQWQSLTDNKITYAVEANLFPQSAFARDHIITQPAIPHLFKGEVYNVPETRTQDDFDGIYTLSATPNNKPRVRDGATTSANVVTTLTSQTVDKVFSTQDVNKLVFSDGYYWLPFSYATDESDTVYYVAIGKTTEFTWVKLVPFEPDPEAPEEPDPNPDDWVEGPIPPLTVGLNTQARVDFAAIMDTTAQLLNKYRSMPTDTQDVTVAILKAIADWVRNSDDPVVAPPDGTPTDARSAVGFVIDMTEAGRVNLADLQTYLIQLNPTVLTIINGVDLGIWVRQNLPDCLVNLRFIWTSREDEPHILEDYRNDWRPLLRVLQNAGVPAHDPMLLVSLVNEPSPYRRDGSFVPTPEFLDWAISLNEYLEGYGYIHGCDLGAGKNIVPEIIANGEMDRWFKWYIDRDRVAKVHLYGWGPLPLVDREDYPENIFDAEKVKIENWPLELDTSRQASIWVWEHAQRRCEQKWGKRIRTIVTEGPQSDNIHWAQEKLLTFNGITMTAKEWFKHNGWSSSPVGDSRGLDHWGNYAKAMLNLTVSQLRFLVLKWWAAHAKVLGGYLGITLFMISLNKEWSVVNGYGLWQDIAFREMLVKDKITL